MKIAYKGKDINPFEEYAKTKQEIVLLEEKRSELEALLQEALASDGLQEKLTPYGHFYSMSRKSWEYSDAVKSIQDSLKKQKKMEELSGTAILKKQTTYIMLDIKETK